MVGIACSLLLVTSCQYHYDYYDHGAYYDDYHDARAQSHDDDLGATDLCEK